jgi:hypothetical protein
MGYLRRTEAPELGVMDPPVGAVDNDVVPIGDLVDQSVSNDLAGYGGLAPSTLEERETGTAVDPGFEQSSLHHLISVGAFAEPAQLGLELSVELPHARLTLGSETHAFQHFESAHSHGPPHPVRAGPQ